MDNYDELLDKFEGFEREMLKDINNSGPAKEFLKDFFLDGDS